MLGSSMDELEGDEFVAALLESGDDLADETALNAVRLENTGVNVDAESWGTRLNLDHDVGALVNRHGGLRRRIFAVSGYFNQILIDGSGVAASHPSSGKHLFRIHPP